MDRQKLGEVVGAGFAGNEPLNAENWLPVFDDAELLAEIRNNRPGLRAQLAAEQAGPAAVEGAMRDAAETSTKPAEDDAANAEGQTFQDRVGRFLDAETRLEVADQLSVTGELWAKLGYKVPKLSEDQQAKLTKTAEAHPLRRVVPTPLLSLAERKAIAEKSRVFPGQKFSTRYGALWTPDQNYLYGKLLRSPDSAVKEGGKNYGLRYKTPDGEIAGREAYVASLKKAGQAVEAEDGTIWTFPVMDVRVQAPRTYDSVRNLHQSVDPITTPESLLTTQLLHQANGTPNGRWEVDFANEAVYELDKKGNPKARVNVAGVSWYPDYRQVRLSGWSAGDRVDYFGVRGAESGL